MDELMARQAILKARQSRERALGFGADHSQFIDGASVDMLEQAQVLDTAGRAPAAQTLSTLDRYDQSLQANLALKQAQAERIESRLEQLAELQSTQLQQTMAQRPGKFTLPSARARWTDQQQRQLALLGPGAERGVLLEPADRRSVHAQHGGQVRLLQPELRGGVQHGLGQYDLGSWFWMRLGWHERFPKCARGTNDMLHVHIEQAPKRS